MTKTKPTDSADELPSYAKYLLLILMPIGLFILAGFAQVIVHFAVNLGQTTTNFSVIILDIFSFICFVSGLVTIVLIPLWVIRLLKGSHNGRLEGKI